MEAFNYHNLKTVQVRCKSVDIVFCVLQKNHELTQFNWRRKILAMPWKSNYLCCGEHFRQCKRLAASHIFTSTTLATALARSAHLPVLANAKRIWCEFDVTTILSQRYSQVIWMKLNCCECSLWFLWRQHLLLNRIRRKCEPGLSLKIEDHWQLFSQAGHQYKGSLATVGSTPGPNFIELLSTKNCLA